MARFILIAAVAGAPLGGAYTKYPRGTTIADTTENAVRGDFVWPAICNSPSPINMAPLDADAQARMPGSTITTRAELAVSSGGGAAGDGAGV